MTKKGKQHVTELQRKDAKIKRLIEALEQAADSICLCYYCKEYILNDLKEIKEDD